MGLRRYPDLSATTSSRDVVRIFIVERLAKWSATPEGSKEHLGRGSSLLQPARESRECCKLTPELSRDTKRFLIF